jgi:polyribonucleotide nucleotidyltransferase
MVGSPKRREIGHGRLAKRGVLAFVVFTLPVSYLSIPFC